MDQSLHSCMTKAVIADGDQLRTGPMWITSRRGRLKLYSDRLECGNWKIAYHDIREAVFSITDTSHSRIRFSCANGQRYIPLRTKWLAVLGRRPSLSGHASTNTTEDVADQYCRTCRNHRLRDLICVALDCISLIYANPINQKLRRTLRCTGAAKSDGFEMDIISSPPRYGSRSS